MSDLEVRTKLCLGHLPAVARVPGHLIECGVWAGATTVPLAQWVRDNTPDKLVYACDCFEGLPYDGGEFDADLRRGECACSLDQFNANVRAGGVAEFVRPVVGLVEESLQRALFHERFCFAWLDMDLYEPTRHAWHWLANRMNLGGIVGFHDYGFHRCPGIRKFVDEEVDPAHYRRVGQVTFDCIFFKRIK